MQQKDNFDTKRDNTDKLGKKGNDQEVTKKTPTRSADRESEMTPPENEITVNLEPDELHLADEDIEDVDEEEKD